MNVPDFLLSARGWRAAWAWAIVLVLVLRLGLGMLMGAAWVTVKPNLPAHWLSDTSLYGGLPMYASFPADAMLGVWLRWDAIHHVNLARLGYFGVSEGDTVFYPLYAYLTRVVARITGGDYLAGGLMVSTLAALFAFACLYRLADQQYGPASARWTAIALALYPTAFFLIAPFTESLFLALTLGAFLFAYQRQWWLAGILGALGSLTRGPGLLLPVALSSIAWIQWRSAQPSSASRARWAISAVGGLALPFLGGLAFVGWRSLVGFAPLRETLRTYSGLEMTDPARGLFYAVAQLLTTHDLHTSLDVSSVFVFLGLTAALSVNRRWRQGEWVIYMCVHLAVLLSKHSLVASSLQSMARYVLALFPAFIVIGDWLAHRGPRLRFAYIVLSSLGLMLLSVLYTFWWFIG